MSGSLLYRKCLPLVLFAVPALAQENGFVLPPAVQRPVDFVKEVQPILKKCQGCHGPAVQTSGVRFDNGKAALAGGYSGPVIVPGNSAESKLIHRVAAKPGVMVMPPSGPRLTAEQVGILRAWIDAGAKWEGVDAGPPQTSSSKHPHWAFQPVRDPAVPTVAKSEWVTNPVDAFVLSRLEKEKIEPSPEADKRTLLRRLSFDLIGLPPTPAEMRAFLNDTRPDAWERAVDRLLDSPHFGERWARPWLDRARYADSDGYEKDWVRPWAWRYRDWVIQALNSDMPFDQFTVQQIAGDLIPDAGPGAKIAAGFHRHTLTNREGGIDNKQFLFEAAVDRASTIGSAWLGLTVGCAQCHDHKFDPISQKDFYSLYAFFENMDEVDTESPLPGEIGPWLRSRDEYRAKREALLKEYKVHELMPAWEKEMLVAAANPGQRTDWDLAWDCLLKMTEGGADGERILRKPAAQRTEREQDTLTTHFVRNYHFAVGKKVADGVHKMDELDKKLRELYASYPQRSEIMTVGDLPRTGPTHLRVRGDYRTLGIEVKPDTLSVLPAMKATGDANRLNLAQWVASKENPLTSRVAVNWVWQEIFGKGLVRTAEDFGTRGDKPSHPEMLDWLAHRFMEDGWSVKKLIRTIVTSSTYRQSSKLRPDLEKDPDNSLLARMSRLRLPAELIRDSALHAGSLLSMEIGGKSIRPPQPDGVASLAYGSRTGANWEVSKGSEQYRRGLYIHFQRATPYPLLMNFDAPKSVVSQCRRERSNTALQALNLLNDPVFMEAATALAYNTIGEASVTDARIDVLFERALSRPPSLGEKERFRKGYETLHAQYAKDDKAAAEVAPAAVPGASRAEAAAWVNLASVLLNLDEFITKE